MSTPTNPDWLKELLKAPTCDVPTAGKALGLARNASYEASARGEIKTLTFGRKRRVPTQWLREVLSIKD